MAQVISAELRLEAVPRVAKRGGHYSRIGDNHVEAFAVREQFFGTGTHVLEIGKVKRST